MQELKCEADASERSMTHDLCHAAGMIHEQGRSGRNKYIVILSKNVRPDKRHNFVRHPNSINTTSYDFRSIMQYSAKAFSRNGGPTLQPLVASKRLAPSAKPTLGYLELLGGIDPHLRVVRRYDAGRGSRVAGRGSRSRVVASSGSRCVRLRRSNCEFGRGAGYSEARGG